jgi:hypothetical protein
VATEVFHIGADDNRKFAQLAWIEIPEVRPLSADLFHCRLRSRRSAKRGQQRSKPSDGLHGRSPGQPATPPV